MITGKELDEKVLNTIQLEMKNFVSGEINRAIAAELAE